MKRAFYLLRIGRAPAVLNFVINGLIGLAFFARKDAVPWTDVGSVGADLLLGGGIVATATAWTIVKRVKRDAGAGVVPGLPASSPIRFLLPNNRTARAVLIGFVVAIGLLLALIPPLEAAVPAGIPGLQAALFKAVTSAVAGQLAIFAAGYRTLVGAPDRTAEIVPGRVEGGVTLEPIALACLAGTSAEHGSSVSPTWRVRLEGDVTDDQLVESFDRMSHRVPVTRSVVRPVDGTRDASAEYQWIEKDFPYGQAIPVTFVDGTFEQARHQALNRHLDLFEVGPVHVTVHRGDDAIHVFMQQHHGIADGRAFLEFITAWGETLTRVRNGEPDVLTDADVWRSRPEHEAYGRTDAELRKTTRKGAIRHAKETWNRRTKPLPRLPWNKKAAQPGGVSTVHVTFSTALFDAWRPLRKEWGVGQNAILTGAYLRSAHRLYPDVLPLACELVAETRPRDGSFRSFANHLSVLFLPLTADQLTSLETTAKEVHRQVRAEVADDAIAERALIRGWGARHITLDVFRPLVLDNVEMQTQLGFSNLTSLGFPPLGDGRPVAEGGWRVTDARVTTPALPPHYITLTAVQYGDDVTFNFNFNDSVVDEPTVRALAEGFVAALDTLGHTVDARYEVSR